MTSLSFLNLSPLIAYIGPGMGGGIIAVIFGILAGFFLALWGIIYYPLKRAFKNKTKINKRKNKLSDKKTKK